MKKIKCKEAANFLNIVELGPHVIQVIKSSIKRGKGTEDDVIRWVDQYHSLDGKLLAENDPVATKQVGFINSTTGEGIFIPKEANDE